MKPITLNRTSSVFLAGVLLLSATAGAQQKALSTLPQSRAYDRNREVSIQGTVLEYKAVPAAPPLGAHVSVQTSAGIVDVYLGNPQLLAANHFSLAPGDAVHIVGENLNESVGTQFVARIIQKGTQALAIRSLQGIPLKPGLGAASGAQANAPQGRAL
jgi:hypothetical protein